MTDNFPKSLLARARPEPVPDAGRPNFLLTREKLEHRREARRAQLAARTRVAAARAGALQRLLELGRRLPSRA